MSLPELAPHHRAAVARFLDGARDPSRSLIAIAPATQWKSKQWPPEHWIALMRLLLMRTAATIVLIGSSADAALIARLAGAVGDSAGDWRLLNLAGKTSTPQLYALLERIAVLIATDTAPLHIAGAAGCRLIGLFGATPADRTGPIGLRRDHVAGWPPALCRRIAVAFEFGDLALDQLEALDLAADLDCQPRRQRTAVTGHPGGDPFPAIGPAPRRC